MSTSPKPWQSLILQPAVAGIKSILSHEERRYLAWLTREKYEGWGAVVDLGPWIGGSSVALADGIRRGRKEAKIFSFDLFVWEPSYMEAISPEGLKQGADFFHIFMREIGDYGPFIEAQKEDLKNYVWDRGPIEILFVNAAKSWELTNSILRGFGHQLVPGKSRIVLQGFRHYSTYWLPAIFYSRPDLWKELEGIDNGWMASFMPLKSLLGPAGIDRDYSEDAFPMNSYEPLIKARIARETPSNGRQLLCSLYRKCLIDGPIEKALELRSDLLRLGDCELASIEDVDAFLIPKGWAAYNRQDYVYSKLIAERCLSIKNNEPASALMLLAFSLFREGDYRTASIYMERALASIPDSSSLKLLKAELDIVNGRRSEAEKVVFDVLGAGVNDEKTLEYCLNVLEEIWKCDMPSSEQVYSLAEQLPFYRNSSAFLAHLARHQFRIGVKEEATQNLRNALIETPHNKTAIEVQAEWGVAGPDTQPCPAGHLNVALIPCRSQVLRDISLHELGSELLARISDGLFALNHQHISLGCEILEALRVSLDVHENRQSLKYYRDMFWNFYDSLEQMPPNLDGITVVDLGCGSINPYGTLFMFLALGAHRGLAVDLDRIQYPQRAIKALADLAAMILIDPEAIYGCRSIAREQVIRNISSFNLPLLRRGDETGLDPERLRYVSDSADALKIPSQSVDLLISNAFLEHLPYPKDVIKENARVMRKEGIAIHLIDGSDHWSYSHSDYHPLEFLTQNTDAPLVHESNRIRPLFFKGLFENNGFEVLSIVPMKSVEMTSDFRDRLVEPFRSMDEESLSVTCAKIVVRRL
jgi:SAM-dependent methyltransferase